MATQLNTPAGVSDSKVTAHAAPAAPGSRVPKWEMIAPRGVAVILALLPPPSGLAHFAWLYFSIFAGVIVGLILEPLPGAAIAIIGLTLVTVLAPSTRLAAASRCPTAEMRLTPLQRSVSLSRTSRVMTTLLDPLEAASNRFGATLTAWSRPAT
jgi:hypothetical protein